MDKIRLEILGLTASRSQTGSFALVLGEVRGKRRIPIVIGMFEAQAIAIEMEDISSSRPMTHDLFKLFTTSFGVEVHEVIISELKEGVFYAKIITGLSGSTDIVEIDARPSDAIAIGIRHKAPIYVAEAVLDEAGIIVNDQDEFDDPDDSFETVAEEEDELKEAKSEALADKSSRELEELLKQAIEQEEYERAAKIRDELDKR